MAWQVQLAQLVQPVRLALAGLLDIGDRFGTQPIKLLLLPIQLILLRLIVMILLIMVSALYLEAGSRSPILAFTV
jgi:hypothetical protein